jgi:hypothetical protein
MADPTAVNAQITDAVTQSNAPAVAQAPAVAVGTIYQAVAQSIGLTIENAAQYLQSMNTIANAALAAALVQLMQANDVPDVDEIRNALQKLQQVHASRESAVAASAAPSSDAIAAQIEAAVKLANETVLGHAGDVAYAIRAGTDAAVGALNAIGTSLHQDRLRTLQMAATAACLEGMLRDPAKAAEYEAVLQVVKRIA